MKIGYALLIALILANTSACTAVADISSFEECVSAGNLVLKSLPAQCLTQDGRRFVDTSRRSNKPGKICEDHCGDGICQEIVCMGTGCPCAETQDSCAKDCHLPIGMQN